MTFIASSVFGGFDRLQIMHRRGIKPGLDHRRHAADLVAEALREGARVVVEIPVEGVGEDQALALLQADQMRVGDFEQERDQLLAAGGQAEFAGLLDRVGGVAAGVGERHDFGLRGLRLQTG